MMKAWLDERHIVTIEADRFEDRAELMSESGLVYSLYYEKALDHETAVYRCNDLLPVERSMRVKLGTGEAPVYLRRIVRDPAFDAEFPGDLEKLGAVLENEVTVFRVWSPCADSASVRTGGTRMEMTINANGTWEAVADRDLSGTPYLYECIVHGEEVVAVDPYAKALTANGEAAVVYHPESRESAPARPFIEHTQDSIIYELHIRDATIHPDSGVTWKGKYKGLTERGTVNRSGDSTGLSYIKELGVTHVECLPFNDFARVDDNHPDDYYNWGYDPLFFQVPEGSYATDPRDPFCRIHELQEMIDAFHEEGLGVIADVVFNHVFIREESSFEKLVPGYYFRFHLDGSPSNGTGVGNDFASERHMARKFILDTIDYWLTHFRLDGFRFDLMGALDKLTMRLISARCQEEEVPVVLLGEGWDLPTALASDQKTVNTQAGDVPEVRFFNDFFRDTVKGGLFDFNDFGFVNGKGRFIERMPQLVKGSADTMEWAEPHVSEVTQTVNYVECHDNHTLWDRLRRSNEEESEADRRAMHELATALVIISQGVPFLHAGQEFFRTKFGEGNSYISGDRINQLDWERRTEFDPHIDTVKELIAVRKKYGVFRLRSAESVRSRLHMLSTPAPVFGFLLLAAEGDIAFYINPTKRRYELQLPASGIWRLLVSNKKVERVPLEGEFMHLEPYEFMLVKKSRQ
ncbi:type I pullulanase [Alkalicoccus luteus]|uniref:Type I pullulanase n=1 Tax=Alkalicoccus luteus TaxID=1237094 RepID=A0A969PS36_9BACI|nr:type I pullulanase [Alkalicoccus luteus]NJP36948.1 type I pullulanase [Alkalicoccus luteus]